MEGSSPAAPPALERLSVEAPPRRPDSPLFARHAPPIALPLPARREGRRWRRRAARCLLLGPLALGGAVLVACFLMCPMLWLRMPPGSHTPRAVMLGAAAASLWVGAAAGLALYWRQRRRPRPHPRSPHRKRPRSLSLDSATHASPTSHIF